MNTPQNNQSNDPAAGTTTPAYGDSGSGSQDSDLYAGSHSPITSERTEDIPIHTEYCEDCADLLRVESEDLGNGLFVIRCIGSMELATDQLVRRKIAQMVSDSRTNIIFDFQQVDYVDSTGLAVVLSTLRRVRERGGSLCIVSKVRPVLRLMALTQLDRLLPIYETMEQALAAAHTKSNPE